MKYYARVNKNDYALHLSENDDGMQVTYENASFQVDLNEIGDSSFYSLLLNNQSYDLIIEEVDHSYYVKINGYRYSVHVEDELERQLEKSVQSNSRVSQKEIVKSQMPGLIVRVDVAVGDEVEEGTLLLIVEAMKMENEIRAQRKGTITKISVSEQQNVEAGDSLLEIS